MSKRRHGYIGQRPLDLMFAPRYRLKKNALHTGYDLLLRQVYKDALRGDVGAIKQILIVARAQERVHGPRHYPTRYSNGGNYVSAVPAMRLLGILVGGKSATGVGLGLPPWVGQALELRNATGFTGLVCKPEDVSDRRYSLYEDALYIPARPARDPADTRFKPGRSGNPRGRRPANGWSSAPVHFLDELVEANVTGEPRKITRFQYLIYQIEIKALKGDEGLRKLLLEFGLKVEMERYRDSLEPDQLYFSQSPLDNDLVWLFDELKALKILNSRSRKYHLLMPWIVELALARLEPGALNDDEQAVVVRATSTPERVRWPEWWDENRRKRQRLKRREGHVGLSCRFL